MYSDRDSGRTRRLRQAAMLILIALIMMVLAIPSFADNETVETGNADKEAVLSTGSGEAEVSGDEEKQMSDDAEKADTETVQAEEAEKGAVTEEEADKTGAADEESAAEEIKTEDEEGAKAEVKEPAVTITPAPKVTVKKEAKAASDSGKKVSYTGSKAGSAAGETTIFKVTSDGTTYTGTCAEQGVSMSSSGTATITQIPNSKKIAKVVYHYAIELGDDNWWSGDHKTDKVGKLLGMSNDSDTNVTKRRMVEAFCQIYNMGSTDWYNTITNPNSGGWNTGTADKVRDFYTDISDKNWYKDLTVPDGFEIWFADAGNAQPFIIWAYNPTGFVTLKKVSADTSISG